MKLAIPIIVILVVGLLVYWCVFTVDFNEIVIVKTFGGAATPIYGREEGGAGLHAKWPWPVQKIVRYSASTFVLEDPETQAQTSDQQQVYVNVFCAWRIDKADRFHTSIKTVRAAEDRLRDLLRSENLNVVGTRPLSEFLHVAADPASGRTVGGIEKMEQEILARIQPVARNDYGVQIVAVGIRSFGLTKTVSGKVIDNMKQERQRFAEEYRSRGKAYADLIKSRADASAEIIASFADSRSQSIRNQGERDAAAHYKVYKDNERFAIFLRELEFLKETLKDNTVFVGSSELDRSFGYFQQPPTGDSVRAKAGAVAGSPSDGGNGR
ncbi:MAG TPA: SPFH domain-containing protein [Phycisphaerae bacterium]|nr:SPFH domain-containing protein [Phycisphaerae bacterium]